MRLLFDTHLLLWAAREPQRLSGEVIGMILDPNNERFFSVASVWEVVIKSAKGQADFAIDPLAWRSGLLANGYSEIAVLGSHALEVSRLPAIHRDPFDRMLVAQAKHEGMTLLTVDAAVAQCGQPVRLV